MADFTQNYNRYSYALNNPLVYTDPDGELLWFIPIIIGAVIGGTSGAVMAHQAGAKGFGEWAGYIGGGALIGGLSGGAAAGVSALGGGAMIAGAAAGAVGGAGFNGLATGWDGNAMLKGAAIGAAAGFIGGGVASAIGGPGGAFAGGFASDVSSQLLGTGDVNLGRSLLSGGISFGIYHGMQYMQYSAMDGKLGQMDVTYRQFSKINTAYQRSRFWTKEHGVILNKDGSAKFVPRADRHKYDVTLRLNPRNGDYATAHTHWAKDGVDLGGGLFTVGGHHSPNDFNIPGYSLVVGRATSTYSIGGTGAYNYITPDPFIRFFMFPWNW